MLQSFVITLREGIEAALAIAIVLAYLKKSGNEHLSSWVYRGLWAALGVSAIGAVIVHRLAVDTDAYEGYFMVLGAIVVASMVYWMWRTAKGLKGEIEDRLGQLITGHTSSGDSASDHVSRRAATGIFLFVFLMVGREGVETVLFLSAVSLNTTALLNFTGGILGLAAAVAFGVLFVRGSIRVNLRQFFTYTTAILFLVAIQLLISGIHELSESHVLPSSTQEMRIIGPIVHSDAYFFVLMLALSAIVFLANRPPAPQPAADQAGRAAWRLQLAEYRRQQRVRVLGGSTALILAAALAAQLAHENALARPPQAQAVTLTAGEALVPVSSLRDGQLRVYQASIQGTAIRFMAVRLEPSKVKTAFDACSICEKTFFYQSGPNVVCSNCSATLFMPSIGQAGGCNPIPLDSALRDGYLHITEKALLAEKARFTTR